jgi:hypothetical protein
MVREASAAGGLTPMHESDGNAESEQPLDPRGGTNNLTEELARLLAATIAQGQQGKRLPGVATGSELASLAALVSASQGQQRPAQPSFRDGLSSLSYTPPAAAVAPSPMVAPGSSIAPATHSIAPSHNVASTHSIPSAPSGGLLVSDHHDDEPMPIPSTWRQPVNGDDERWYRQQVGAAALGLLAGLIVVVPSVLWLSGWLGGPQATKSARQSSEQGATIKVADVKPVRVVPVEKTESASQYTTAAIEPRPSAVIAPPPVVEKAPVAIPPGVVMAPPPRVEPPKAEPPRPRIEEVLAEVRQRISSGDMAGARALLTTLQDVAPATTTFALAETYDPNMLASWQTRGVTAEPERAKALYMRARELGDNRAQQRIEWLLGR